MRNLGRTRLNPHAALSVRVTSASGDTETWSLESWGSPYVLSRMGVTEDQFVVGSRVRLAGRVSNLVPNRFLLTNMLRPDGTEVVLSTDDEPFWAGRQVGGRAQWRDDEISTAAQENRGIFRVWSTARMGQARDNRIMLTQQALAARASFDQLRSFVVSCEPYYDTIGTPLTPDVEITERFTLSDDQSALTYRQTVTDPATFTEPAIHESDHIALGETIEPFVCAPDL